MKTVFRIEYMQESVPSPVPEKVRGDFADTKLPVNIQKYLPETKFLTVKKKFAVTWLLPHPEDAEYKWPC